MSTVATPLSAISWALVVRGLIAIAFAILTFAWPGVTLGAIVILFAVYALVDGAAGIAGALKEKARGWAPLVGGIISVVAAIVTLINPALTLLTLVTLVAIWAIARGVLDIVAAIKLRREIEGEWLLALGGAMSILFGTLVVLAPRAGALVTAWWIAIYALVFGLVLLVCGVKLRSLAKRLSREVLRSDT